MVADDSVLEYPQKSWLDPVGFAVDLDGASATCNLMQHEAHDVLLVEMMTRQNKCPVRTPRPISHYPDSEFRRFDEDLQHYCPWLLFHHGGLTSTKEHGPFVERFLFAQGRTVCVLVST